MVDAFSPLVWNVPIVNPDGTPTPQFIVLLQEALDAVDASGGDIAALKDAPFVMMGSSAETPNERVLTAGTAIDITDGGPGSTATVLLENTAVTPGTYGDDVTVSQVTVDAQGRITAAVDVPIDFPSSPTALEVEDNGAPIVSTDTVNFLAPLSAVDNAGVADISLDNTAVAPGSYGSSTQVGTFTVDAKGRLTAASNVSVSFAGYVPDTRTLTAGAGLTGGGDLSANRTFDVGAGTGIAVNANDVAIANTAVTPASYGDNSHVGAFTVDQQGRLTAASSVAISPTAIGGVPSTRTLTAGAGLTGGGDLSADRTFDVGAGTGITVNANDVALDTASTRNTDHAGVTITAGAGLTGGGDITTTRTLDVGAGTGITVNANDVAIANTAVTPAAYGSATQVGTFTVDQQGRLTLAGNTTIALNASAIAAGTLAAARGGTGVSNTGTITLGGNLVTSGAFDLTLTQTAASNVTLPTTGTLATLAGTETLTNKTLTAPKITGFTAGSVLFTGASGVVSEDNSNLFWNNTSKFLGIGVAPSFALDVVTSGTTIALYRTTSSVLGVMTVSGATVQMQFGIVEATGQAFIGSITNHDLLFLANNAEAGRFSTAGNFQMGGANTVIDASRLFRLRSYTVATLPAAGTAGRLAMVSDALAPGFLTVVVGGGAVKTPVFDNGANWVAF